MDLKQLQSFVQVVEKKSFSGAANALFLSQPTVSNHVRLLEEELGCALIARTTKSLEITPVGEKVFTYARSILDLQDRIRMTCSTEETHVIHIGASTIPSAYILPDLLASYGHRHPEVYFNVHQSDSRHVIEEFEDGLYDIGMIGVRHENAHTICTPICKDRMVLIAPPSEHYLTIKRSGSFSLEQLKEEPIILREHGSGSLKFADNFLSESGISENDLHIVARINDQEAIKQMVSSGLGVSILSEKAAASLVREKRVLCFELPGASSTRTLYLIQKKKSSAAYVRDFADFVLAEH